MAVCPGTEPAQACGLWAEQHWMSAPGITLSDTYGYESVPLTTLVTLSVLSCAAPFTLKSCHVQSAQVPEMLFGFEGMNHHS